MARRIATTLLVVLSLNAVFPRAAEAGEGDASATADALFREGRAALARGDYADAAAKLEESRRLEPTPGTLVSLAIAEEKLGLLAAAWEHARAAIDQMDLNDDRVPPARALFERVDRRLPRLTIAVRGLAPPGLRIERNGLVLGPGSLGTPLPVNPGTQRIVVKADGHEESVYVIALEEGASEALVVEPGPRVPERTSSAVAALAANPAPTSPATPVGYAIAMGGGAAIAAGGVLGLLAIERKGRVEAACDSTGCTDAGVDAARDGRTFATLSTVTMIGGAVVAAAGLALVLLSRPGAGISAKAGVGAPRSGASWTLSF